MLFTVYCLLSTVYCLLLLRLLLTYEQTQTNEGEEAVEDKQLVAKLISVEPSLRVGLQNVAQHWSHDSSDGHLLRFYLSTHQGAL